MIGKLRTVFHTIKHLTLVQIVYQVKCRLVKPRSLRTYGNSYRDYRIKPLQWSTFPLVYPCWDGASKFAFLNREHEFDRNLDWNYQGHGKLWNYNLQYANYLLQETVADSEKEQLITDLYAWLFDGRLLLEPYPVSLRAINMIRWLSLVNRIDLAKNVYAELNFLSQRLEYHLLGNHLLENGFALIMGGAFFSNGNWLKIGKKILREELNEQILADGAHFELSPMYHQIIFFRLLELIDWYSKWEDKEPDFENFLREKAILMKCWLENISFKNGDIPHFSDSADEIAYSTPWLISYANSLAVPESQLALGVSGYRSVSLGDYECKVDTAQIGPSYQPGHAHADALSFILYYKGTPLFVEQGTSTYQIGEIRERERSTAAHNTVVVAGRNQSNVWGGFRVAERARTKILADEKYRICAEHDGYRKLGITHRRTFEFDKNGLVITDEVMGSDSYSKEFYLHICPGIDVDIVGNQSVALSNGVTIAFSPNVNIALQQYEMANGYNRYKAGKRLIVSFSTTLKTTVKMGS